MCLAGKALPVSIDTGFQDISKRTEETEMKTYTYGQIQIVRDALELAHDTSYDGENNRKIRGAIDLLDMPLDAFEEVYRLKDEVKRLTAENLRLAGEVSNRNSRALAGDTATKQFDAMYEDIERLTAERDELKDRWYKVCDVANELRTLAADRLMKNAAIQGEQP